MWVKQMLEMLMCMCVSRDMNLPCWYFVGHERSVIQTKVPFSSNDALPFLVSTKHKWLGWMRQLAGKCKLRAVREDTAELGGLPEQIQQ